MYSDTYKIPGNYYCSSDTTVEGLKNCPFRKAFKLTVDYSNGTAYPRQTFIEYNTNTVYRRTWVEYRNCWVGEVSYITNSDLKAGYLSVQFNSSGEVTSSVTFSSPFPTSDYAVSITAQDNNGDLTAYNYPPIIISKRTDGFSFKASRNNAGVMPFVWIATPYK